MRHSEEKAAMRPAYEWTCTECGRNQFESCIVADVHPEEKIEFAKEMGMIGEFEEVCEEDLQGAFVTYPDQVVCAHCGTSFDTEHFTEGQD